MAQRPAWVSDALFPYTPRYADVGGARVHYIDEGTGPPLLLLHGNPTWSFLYRDIVRGLAPRFRCIAPDYPGFGLSRAPAGYDFTPAAHARIVEQFLLARELSGVALMVHDWGGPIGLGVAGRHPQRIRGLIIGNTWAWPVDGDPHFERFSKLVGGPVGGWFIRNFNAFVNVLMRAAMKRRRLSRQALAAYRGPFSTRASRVPTQAFPRAILRGREYLAEVEAGLARLAHLPALIVWGDRDVAFRDVERRRFERLFPRHCTVILRGAGHYIQEEAPEEIVEAIRVWWDTEMKEQS